MSGGAVDPVLALPYAVPTQPIMTACEALFWIGLGVLKTTKELSDETTAFLERWTYLPADSLLRALEGRVATDPYCAIATFVLDGGPEISYAHPALSPNGPRLLRRLRAKARRRERRNVSYRELASLLAEELSTEARDTAQLELAAAELLTEIRSERVTVWGQRDFEPGRPNRGAVHERIPVEIFMHPAMTVTTFDQVRPDGNKPIEQWIDWKGPNFSGVQFKTAEILAIWPAKRHDEPKTGRLPGITDDAEMRREAWAGKEAWSDPDVHFRRENVSALSPQLSETNALSAQYLSEPGLVGPTVSRPYISFADAAHRWAEGESGRLDPGWQDEVLQKLVTALWRGEFPPDALFHPMIPAESFSLGYVSRELLRPNESLPGRYRLTSSYQVGLPPAPQAYEYLATKSLAEYGGTFVGDYLKPLMVRLEVLRSWARRQGYRVPFLEATASANDRLAPEPPGRKLGKRLPLKSIAPTMVPRILETGGIPPGRGRLTGVTNAIREQLLAQGFTYDDSSIRKAIGDLIKKWEHDNPGK